MAGTSNYFVDGAAYELVTGRWSRIAGEIFLEWLALPSGLRWLDVGCGTGAFTEIVLKNAGPRSVSGIDPAPDQIAFAQKRMGAEHIDYRIGDALSLPYGDHEFDVAVMALVIGYLPDRLKAMAELKRVVRPGGTIATYVWDGPDSGHPQQPLIDSLRMIGIEFSPMDGDRDRAIGALQSLFEKSGLVDLVTHTIDVQQSFAHYDEFWNAQNAQKNRFVQAIQRMPSAELNKFKDILHRRLPTDTSGRIAYTARANAIKGAPRCFMWVA
jgi:ubiquinone/menaquinone biosynthesis C-methylase UbiE